MGTWSALASMPRADPTSAAWSALGAAGTYFCALLLLLETALPRPAVLSRSAARGGAGRAEAAGAGNVLPELYIAMVAFLPATGVAQVIRGFDLGALLSRSLAILLGGRRGRRTRPSLGILWRRVVLV